MSPQFQFIPLRRKPARTALVLALGALFLQPVQAKVVCSEILQATQKTTSVRSFDLPENRILKDKDIQKIHQILAEPKSRDRWERAFEVYLDARLEQVPVGHRSKVRERISAHKMIWDNLPTYHIEADNFKIYMSAQFRDTVAPWFIKAHEVEHIIQIYSRSQRYVTLGTNMTLRRSFYDPTFMYRLEREAMKAEWELLSITPEVELQRLHDLIRTSSLTESWAQFFDHSMSAQILDREAYVKAHHKWGRYSVGEVTSISAVSWARLGFKGGLLYLAHWMFF